jgi:hypothetical protein
MERRKILPLPRIEAWLSSPCYSGGGISERNKGIKMIEREGRGEEKIVRKKRGREINKQGRDKTRNWAVP